MHSFVPSFIHGCSYWTRGPRSDSFTFRILNLWLHHPLADVVSFGGNTAWSMAAFWFFYLFSSFALTCLSVVFTYTALLICLSHMHGQQAPALCELFGQPCPALPEQVALFSSSLLDRPQWPSLQILHYFKFSICCFCDVTENSHAVTLLQAWISLVIVKVFTFTFWDRAHPVHSLSCPPTHDPPAVDSPGLGLQVYHTQLL